jgi:hypothetical protein
MRDTTGPPAAGSSREDECSVKRSVVRFSRGGRTRATLQGVSRSILAVLYLACLSGSTMAERAVSANLLKNPSFEKGVDGNGLPVGWELYQQRDEKRRIKVVDGAQGGAKALLIEDDSEDGEIGVVQTVPATGGLVYRAGVWVRRAGDASSEGSYLQMRFLPSNTFGQRPLIVRPGKGPGLSEISVTGTAPEGTNRITLYIYTHAQPTPRVIVDKVELVSGADPNDGDDVPLPVSPVYAKLKDLHLLTTLVRDGRPEAAIVKPPSGLYDAAARRIQDAIKRITGAAVPIIEDDGPVAAIRDAVLEGYPAKRLPGGAGLLSQNLICLGNRSTNRTIGVLYDLCYCFLDLKYPGPGGHVVRTLHSPFGDGRNVILVGGSDAAGVEAAAGVLIAKLNDAGGRQGLLQIGRLMEISLSHRYKVSTDIRQVQTWAASDMYGSTGYFGWNTISKRMALYYMTGDEFHAREFLRLAFPDDAAKKEIAAIDGEMIENKDAPLSGPYHYNAHMMILLWDLIEESPVFTDEQRLRVTNAFSQQLQHRKSEGIYGATLPPTMLGSRHGQWSAISLYCLGRYFQTGCPAPVWRHCVQSSRMHFEALHHSGWIYGESDNLYWYNTGIAPIFWYLIFTGDRRPIENGVVPQLLRGQEVLISGLSPDWALNAASLDSLNRVAYVTGDGRWTTYRNRTKNDMDALRLGQSFWPDDSIRPHEPDDLVGRWSVHPLPEPAWRSRRSGIPHKESFYFASFRSAPDASGDFILLDGFNGASRNPYHTFAILELRLAGHTILQGSGNTGQGYLNQVLTRCDGMVEPQVAMDAALRHCDVLGDTAVAVAEVPNAAFCNWRRSIVQRIGRYSLIVDDLTFRPDSQNMEVETLWQAGRISWDAKTQALNVPTGTAGTPIIQIRPCDPLPVRTDGGVASLMWNGPVKKGLQRVSFSLIGPRGRDGSAAPACYRVAENAAALAIPETAIAVVGSFAGLHADLVVLCRDHLFGLNVKRAGMGATLLDADNPIDIDWDFKTGKLHLSVTADAQVRLAMVGESAAATRGQLRIIDLKFGRQTIEKAFPSRSVLDAIGLSLRMWVGAGRKVRDEAVKPRVGTFAPSDVHPTVPKLEPAWTAQVPGAVVALETAVVDGRPLIFVSEGKAVHLLTADGKEVRVLSTDGPIRVLCWWPEQKLILAGCADEKVVAFDEDGRRRWTFTSEMDPAVFQAAKQYWFKSAHPGIYGLFTGVFLDGRSQAFVGSACTLEIIDENGKLVRRMPVFWGPGNIFQMVDAPDGSRNLLVGRRPNDGEALAIINNRTLSPSPRGFQGVPPGHSYVNGWDGMSRHHLFYEDLEGDGRKEVVSEINGVWNRVTVWSSEGRPLYNAQFGPGPDHHQPDRTIRDLALVDLKGDGKKDILVATSRGLVVALNGHCEKLWSKRLACPPVVLQPVTPPGAKTPLTVVGSEDGPVAVLDARGDPVQTGLVSGRPVSIASTTDASGESLVIIATDKGQVAAFRL